MRRRSRAYAAVRNFLYRTIGIRTRHRRIAAEPQRADTDLNAYLADHVCLRPFHHLDTTNRGHAHVCCPDWLPTPIGDLNGDLLKVWDGPVARRIRASVTDGSYRFCSRRYCSPITNRTLPHRSSKEVQETLARFADGIHGVPPPRAIGLSHDRSCNLACPSCRTDFITAETSELAKLDGLFKQFILPLLKTAERVYITGSGDPFASKHFRGVLKQLAEPDFAHLAIDLHTNALLFDERAFNQFHLSGRLQTVEISIDAATPETYAVLRRGGDFERLCTNLAFIGARRRAGEIDRLDFSMVVQARNFREMSAFVQLAERFSADRASFQMIRNWGTYSAAAFAAEFIGDPAHADHQIFRAALAAPELARPIAFAGNLHVYAR